MAKKKELDLNVQIIKQALKENKVLIGNDEVVKTLKLSGLIKVFMARNVAPAIKEDLEHYCKLANVELIQLGQDNEEIGLIVKKGYMVSVLGLKA
ncbi:50S ribosomal protein L30 [archaeon]|jgi:ribosomal protein L30E|nr:50S ribosomal protein L30 [archaeon]MBT3451527.1 50S ribosomal protein L30 [archaeon]MBT6869386.1 50S ribosomal protein L30 [archaeon]MBT7192549.1 50S ribosomal protein L30 [archaeon]MBT7380625.1 50S ribosomal protein L30 [archaeon]